MSNCTNVVLWNPVPAGARFCVSASGTSNDFNAGVHLHGEDESEAIFSRADVVPGPAHRSLTAQGYAATITMTPGATAPTVTFDAWIEDSAGTKLFACTWTAATASTPRRISIVTVPA
jgi:hypothetical protein